MPELPEVETTRLGISPHLIGQKIREVIIRRFDLRQPVSENLSELEGATFTAIKRRSKYLLLETNTK
ncbi:MAG: DNA-formamidopyrimidine glycosylase family protein, partial [Akkermansiaceae bacterium]